MPRQPSEFPPSFASAYGDDRYGLWANLTVKGVTQRFRWIELGEFWMGSPDDEVGRSEYEGPRHRVRISSGFWMADTACTQAFWLAVVDGENPSYFQTDLNKPVERVSWDDVMDAFMLDLEQYLQQGWQAVLPSEAQWEYACRAGTETPFSFGGQITPDIVNYHGKFPYLNGPEGLATEETVAVSSLPANPWGLFEIHGNVWEWCRDGVRMYSAEPVTDRKQKKA